MSVLAGDPQANGLRADLRLVAEMVRLGEKVLDLGCGDGALLRFLVDGKGVTGRGVELSEAGVLACVRLGLSVRQGNLQEGLKDYPDAAFDTVILSQTLPYLNDPAFIIAEMLRVGRRAVVSFPNWGHWRCRLGLLLGGRFPVAADLPQAWETPPRARPLTIRDFEAFCQRSGFRVASRTFLRGAHRMRTTVAANLRATTAIFELQ